MTMIDGMASLIISSDTYSAAEVSSSLGIEPDWSAERGDRRLRADGAPVAGRRAFHEKSSWALEVDSTPATMMAVDEDEYKSFATLFVLVDRLWGRGPLLAELRPRYTVQISWFGTATSRQVGFVLPLPLMRDLAELGLDLYTNVYPFDAD